LHALLGVVLRLALLPGDLDPVDPAVALVDEVEVVDEAVGDGDAARGVGAGAVDEQGDEDLLALGRGEPGQRPAGEQRDQQPDHCPSHGPCPPSVSDEVIRRRIPAQCGNGHSRSFSLAIRQSGARRRGWTMRKKRMRAPNPIGSGCFSGAPGSSTRTAWGAWVRKPGTSRMNAAPRKEPSTLPSPPMITMNSTR